MVKFSDTLSGRFKRGLGAALVIGTFLVPVSAVAESVTTVALMTPDSANDFGWNQLAAMSMEKVAAEKKVELILAEGLGYGDIRPSVRELAAEGAQLIIGHATGWNSAIAEVADEIKVPVAVVDLPQGTKPGLIGDYTLSGHQGAYLAGVLAASMSRTGTVAVVVSAEPMVWNTQSAGFIKGVLETDANVKVLYSVVGPAAYADAAAARRVTEQTIAAGADIIFGQGNGATFGMLQAVETTKAVDGGQAWFIDVIGDKSSLDKGYLLSSVMWDLEGVFSAMVDDLRAGTYASKGYTIDIADDSVYLLKTKHIPDDVWTKVVAARQDIIDGKIKVDRVFDAADVRKMMAQMAVAGQ